MPYWKCSTCHHEWESAHKNFDICDWCGRPARVLEEKTAFERFLEDHEREATEDD